MENPIEKKVWFKAKRYGWGWYPVSWQGWIVMLVYVVAVVKIFCYMDLTSHSGSDTLISFSVPFIVLTCLLLLVCYKKGEVPGWHWGDKK